MISHLSGSYSGVMGLPVYWELRPTILSRGPEATRAKLNLAKLLPDVLGEQQLE